MSAKPGKIVAKYILVINPRSSRRRDAKWSREVGKMEKEVASDIKETICLMFHPCQEELWKEY